MPNPLVIYMVAHQPRRIRLPAQLIPRGTPPEKMDALIFDDQMDRRYFDKVAKYSYRPGHRAFPIAGGQGHEDLTRFLGITLVADAALWPGRAGRLPEARQPRERRAGRGRALSLLHLLSRHRRLR